MLKIVRFFVEAIFWVAAFLSPALLGVIVAVAINLSNPELISLPIFIMATGAIAGVIFAEWVRRKHGCSNYFGQLLYTPEFDGEKDKLKERRKDNNLS
jgi:hypothetical protein